MFKQEYLWKYLSLDKFVSILENNGLYFTTIKNLKHNIEPDECCILDYHLEYNNVKVSELQNNIILIKKDMSVEDNIINNDSKTYNTIETIKHHSEQLKVLKKDFLKMYNGMIQNIFVCSFTNDFVENYALWKIYPTDLNGNLQINQGIALKFSKQHLLNIFENPKFILDDNTIIQRYKVLLREMKYESRENIIEYSKQLTNDNNCRNFYELIHSLKIEYYKYEKEVRAVIQMFDENKNKCNGGFLKISPKDLFKVGLVEIHISPFATKSLSSYVEFLLKEYELNSDLLIKKSDIQIFKV